LRLIVCGSRTFTDRAVVNTVLNGFWWPAYNPVDDVVTSNHDLLVIQGGAVGADEFAKDWADSHDGVGSVTVHADWRKHGRRAGPLRNQRMIEMDRLNLVLAFVNKPLERSVGTFDMVRRARGAEVPVWVIEVRPTAPQPQGQLFDS
jgi:hypothetical protein